jgi:hypothetical protein
VLPADPKRWNYDGRIPFSSRTGSEPCATKYRPLADKKPHGIGCGVFRARRQNRRLGVLERPGKRVTRLEARERFLALSPVAGRQPKINDCRIDPLSPSPRQYSVTERSVVLPPDRKVSTDALIPNANRASVLLPLPNAYDVGSSVPRTGPQREAGL